MRRAAWGGLAVAMGCVEVRYQRADLQLDVLGAVPEGAASVRVCVRGVGQRVVGAREDGRLSFLGIPAGAPVDVTVDVLDSDGALLGQALAPLLSRYAAAPLELCADTGSPGCAPCEGLGQLAAPGEPAWVLGVRFVPDDP